MVVVQRQIDDAARDGGGDSPIRHAETSRWFLAITEYNAPSSPRFYDCCNVAAFQDGLCSLQRYFSLSILFLFSHLNYYCLTVGQAGNKLDEIY